MKINLPHYGECDDEQVGYLLSKIAIERERMRKYSEAFGKVEEPLQRLGTNESFDMLGDLRTAYQANCEDARSGIFKILGRFFNGTQLI